MLNILIQLCTFAYGVVINFAAPMVYGLTAYGEFIAMNAVVLLVYRSMTIISEPLIRFTSPERLLASSLTLNGLVFVLFFVLDRLVGMGSSVLLAGLLLNASVILAMQAMRLRRSYIVFLLSNSTLFCGLMFWSAMQGFSIPLVRVMEISTWVPSSIAILYLFMQGSVIPGVGELRSTIVHVVRHVPRIISITAAMNLLTSALPVFLAPILPARDLGLFKVMTSIIQSAAIVFPVSTQTVLTNFVQHPRGVEFYRLLSSIAMFYFAAVCIGLTSIAMIIPALLPYVALATCLPVYYQAILLERHLTATGKIRVLVFVNWSVVAGVMVALGYVQDVEQAALLYAAGFAVYAVALAFKDSSPYPPMLAILVLCPIFVSLMAQYHVFGIIYGVLVAFIAWLRHRPTRDDVMLLWREL